MTTTVKVPASIRHKNPGAMGLGTSAKRFGATKQTVLNDGARNTIATFPTDVDGAGALFHLLYTSYAGMTVWAAMHKWGDGATLEKKGDVMAGRLRTDGYVLALSQHSRFRGEDVLSKEVLENPALAIEFGKAMARHEAGLEYPMTDAQWREAHGEFLTVIRGGGILIDRKQPVMNLKPLELARARLGEREIPGPQHNPFIVQCFKDVDSSVRNDETAWCVAFGAAMLKAADCAYLPGVLEARKYLNYGHELDEPEVGCIVIFWRESPTSWKGHFAFVESYTATTLTIIGGNQGNAVTRMVVPRVGKGSQVLGYRRPVAATRKVTEVVQETTIQRKIVGGFGSLGALLWSTWDTLTAGAHFIGEVIGILPDTAAQVGSAVSAGKSLTESAGLPWPIELGLFITVCAVGIGIYESYKRLKANKGDLTTAPYAVPGQAEAEVDFDADAGDIFDAPSMVLGGEPVAVASGKGFTRQEVQKLLETIQAEVRKGQTFVVDGESKPRKKTAAKRKAAAPRKAAKAKVRA